ncbi:unnamed protein product [Urochloa humidicola]
MQLRKLMRKQQEKKGTSGSKQVPQGRNQSREDSAQLWQPGRVLELEGKVFLRGGRLQYQITQKWLVLLKGEDRNLVEEMAREARRWLDDFRKRIKRRTPEDILL